MHDYRKFKVSVNGRIGRTARLSERLRRYVTSNPASPATRRRATPTTSPTWPRSCRPCAMRARTTWSSSAPGVLERLLAVGGLGEQHPHAGLSTQRAQHRQRRRLLALLRPKQPAVRGQALAGVACRRRQNKYESPQSTPVAAAQPHASGPSPTERWAMSAEARLMAKPAPNLSCSTIHVTNDLSNRNRSFKVGDPARVLRTRDVVEIN